MLDLEEPLQQRLNDAGVVATENGLRQFVTDGSPSSLGAIRLSIKGPQAEDYQTPYGIATVILHVY